MQKWRRQARASEVKTSHNPNVKHTAQESGGELCDIFKLVSFLYSKSINNDCELLQLLGDFTSRPTNGAWPSPLYCWTSVLQTPSAIAPKLQGLGNISSPRVHWPSSDLSEKFCGDRPMGNIAEKINPLTRVHERYRRQRNLR